MCVELAQRMGVTDLAFDQPGTGETPVALRIQGDEVGLGLVAEARRLGNGKVAHFGLSFGRNFSVMSGLTGAVDAAINLGGPIDKSFEREVFARLPFGTERILGNDMRFDRKPSLDELSIAAQKLSRRALLARTDNASMLVINGAEDPLVPQRDTLVFAGRPCTEVHLLPDSGHCALSKLSEFWT